MSRDIRSFFTVISKKSGKTEQTSAKKPAKVLAIDSSDEDIIPNTPDQVKKKVSKVAKSRKSQIIKSDSEDESSKNDPKKSKLIKNCDQANLKPAKLGDLFKNTPVKQSKIEPIQKKSDQSEVVTPKEKGLKKLKNRKSKKIETEIGVHDDKDFERTLMELDEDVLVDNIDLLDKTIDDALAKDQNTKLHQENTEKQSKVNGKNHSSEESKQKIENHDEKSKKRSRNSTGREEHATSSKKQKLEHVDSGIVLDQDSYEKKRHSAVLYKQYLNRSGPKHHGSKEIPKGKPDCLKNLCFLRTGVLDSLESDEFNSLITNHGGRVVHGVSRKVNFLVVGDEPGPSKLEKAQSYGIPNISEDDLLDMILVKSGMPPKFAVNKEHENQVEIPPNVAHAPKSKQKSPQKSEEVRNLTKQKSPKKVESTTKTNEDQESIKNSIPDGVDKKNLSFADKYKPTSIKGIIGQQGDGSIMIKLRKWLMNWRQNRKDNPPKPSPWVKNYNGAYFKCALLSGPPGIGKTTTANLVAKDLGFDVVEFNASDTRSKKLLHEEVAQLLSTQTIAGYAHGDSQSSDSKRVLLMDEVDGMAGNEDRGGMQELIALIKKSNVPIICMCNDRQHQKIRSLVNHCYDLRFSKPKLEQIKGVLMSICFKEGIDISPAALSEIILGTGCDVRQSLNHLQMWTVSKKNFSVDQAGVEAKSARKDTVLGHWEVCKTIFNRVDHEKMSVADKSRLFFYDYSMCPLFVQENYLRVQPHGCRNEREVLVRVAKAADSISLGDLVDAKIRKTNNWALLESQAMFASVLPGFYMSGHFKSQINFPGWLGKNSKKNKFSRILSEIQTHTRTSISTSKLGIKLDYVVPLRNSILYPLKNEGLKGVEKAVDVMVSYNLLREDLDGLIELSQWGQKSIFSEIDPKIKSAFTRYYNKSAPLLPFSLSSGTTKKKSSNSQEEEMIIEEEENENLSDNEEEKNNINNDAMIKVKESGKNKKEDGPSSKKTAKKATKYSKKK